MSDTIIRKAVLSDLEDIVNFIDKFYRRDYFMPTAHVERIIDGKKVKRKPLPTAVLVKDGQLIGFAVKSKKGALINLLVHPDFRGLGYGTQMLNFLSPKFIRVKTNVSTGNPQDFYLERGYEPFRDTDKEHIKIFRHKKYHDETLF